MDGKPGHFGSLSIRVRKARAQIYSKYTRTRVATARRKCFRAPFAVSPGQVAQPNGEVSFAQVPSGASCFLQELIFGNLARVKTLLLKVPFSPRFEDELWVLQHLESRCTDIQRSAKA